MVKSFNLWSITHSFSEKKKKTATESLIKVSKELVSEVNSGVAEVFKNQQILESEAKQLHQQASKFSKLSTTWLQMFNSLNQSLKELGDVENWAKHIHTDVCTIVKSVDNIVSTKTV